MIGAWLVMCQMLMYSQGPIQPRYTTNSIKSLHTLFNSNDAVGGWRTLHLKSDEFVLVHDLFRQEISADSCLVVFAELLMDVTVHERRFPNTAVP